MNQYLSTRSAINLVVSEPYITLEEFCRRTGYKLTCARQMIRAGRLPIGKKVGVNSLVAVNMFELTREADRGCEIVMPA